MSAVKSLSPSFLHPNPSIADAVEHLLPIRKVVEIVGFTRSTISKKIVAGVFPRPAKPTGGAGRDGPNVGAANRQRSPCVPQRWQRPPT
jgi:predicted DNA-binding transcriptional regulator AlpA